MDNLPVGNFTSTLMALFKKGIRYSTVIDLGCADGSFFVSHYIYGFLQGAVPMNVDANSVYERSLVEIQNVLGGHYQIAAVSDQPGEIEMTTSVHPYWSSLRPKGDPYWKAINNLHEGRTRVPAVTLDHLVKRYKLMPPYLLKLDIQGAEELALRGGKEMLSETDVVICEADIGDFTKLNSLLVEAGFDLFDVTNPNWLSDRVLGWFYPIYLNRRRRIERKPFWSERDNDRVIKLQVDRRTALLKQNADMLSQIRPRGKID